MSNKEWIGALAIGINILGDLPYFVSIFRRQTRPHAFSWAIWALAGLVTFCAQYVKNAGPGAWPTGFGAFDCFSFFILALFYGERTATKSDWGFLILALMAIPLWVLTRNPLSAVLLLTGTNAIACYFTFKKAYRSPAGESAVAYLLWGLSFLLGLFVLENYSVTTLLYPAFVLVTNWSLSVLIVWRRRVLSKSKI